MAMEAQPRTLWFGIRVVSSNPELPSGLLWITLPFLDLRLDSSWCALAPSPITLGISYLELLIMFETHVGHRLICEKAVRPQAPGFIPVFLPVLRKRSGTGVSFFLVFSGLWAIFLVVSDFFPASLVLTTHVGWGQCGHGLSSRLRESCDVQEVKPLLDFSGYPEGAATELKSDTLKLRFSSIPFSKRFPSWPVPDLTCGTPVVGASPGPRFHFPRDPVHERPAKRYRITGKSSADKRARVASGDLPTPERWKRLAPQRT